MTHDRMDQLIDALVLGADTIDRLAAQLRDAESDCLRAEALELLGELDHAAVEAALNDLRDLSHALMAERGIAAVRQAALQILREREAEA